MCDKKTPAPISKVPVILSSTYVSHRTAKIFLCQSILFRVELLKHVTIFDRESASKAVLRTRKLLLFLLLLDFSLSVKYVTLSQDSLNAKYVTLSNNSLNVKYVTLSQDLQVVKYVTGHA